MIEYGNIVVAVDFSEQSDVAFSAALEMAAECGAVLHIVHAFHHPVPAVSAYEISLPPDFFDAPRKAALRELQAAAEKTAAEGVDVEWHLVDGPAGHAIVEFAEEVKADLIVVGTRGVTGLKHIILGSVAEHTVRTAHCSVLTVKSH